MLKLTKILVFFCALQVGAVTETDLLEQRLCINLVWLNKDPSPSIIYGARSNPHEVVKAWFNQHPEHNTKIYFWFDSNKLSAFKENEASIIEEENQTFRKLLTEDEQDRFSLRDIRSLEGVKKYQNLFATKSVYLQADLSRFLILKELIDKNECDTALYADLNVTPESRKYLANPETAKFLDEYGFVNLRHYAVDHILGGYGGFENKMLIMHKNDNLWQAFDPALINPLQTVVNSLGNSPQQIDGKVYGQIQILFVYVLYMKGLVNMANPENFILYPLNTPITDRSGNVISLDGLTTVTQNYYYNNDDYNILLQAKKKRIKRRINTLQESIDDEQNNIKNFEKNPNEKNMNNISAASESIKEHQSRIDELEEQVRKMTIDDIKNEIEQTIQQARWPKDLPVPALRMHAPHSHFG